MAIILLGISFSTFAEVSQISTQKLNKEPSRAIIFEYISDYLLVDLPESIEYIQLYYTDVTKTQKQYEYLQKIVYT